MKKGMKYIVVLFVMLTTITSNIALTFAKDENWNDTIYHLTDPNEVLTEEEFKEENKLVTQAITDTKFDIATFIVDDHFFAKMGFSAYLSAIYEQNEMGYGVNHDGIVLGIDTTNEEYLIKTFGRGNEIFKKDEFEQLQNIIEQSYQKGSILTAQQSYRESVVEIVEESSEWVSLFEEDYPAGYEMEPTSLVTGQTTQTAPSPKEEIVLPDWYVKDPSTFKDFHNDKNTPRLIDNADIFTEEEEAQIAPRLKEILDTYHEDVVVYTDIISYGIDNELYANDFYVYNGYGYGDTYDGLILFVNMDPDNREMITSACGQAKETFTQYNSNALDDVLYDYFVQKNYGQGVLAWLDCVENLMHYGSLHVSEWYKNYIDGTQDPNASNYKLVDDIGYFDEETGKEIADELRSLKKEYGMDFVVYLTDQAYDINGEGLSDELKAQNYADTFYKAQGYDKDGVLLTIYTEESSICNIQCRTFGKADAMFSDKIKSRLESLTLTNLGSGNYEKNITRYLSYLKTFLKTGRLPHTWPVRIMWACMCLFAGLILGSIQLGAAKAKMRVVKKATGARSELVNNSMKVLHSRDIYETTTVSKVYSPQKDNSNSRGSSGGSRSSYSSHSSSSSGRSFSSSRRKF